MQDRDLFMQETWIISKENLSITLWSHEMSWLSRERHIKVGTHEQQASLQAKYWIPEDASY